MFPAYTITPYLYLLILNIAQIVSFVYGLKYRDFNYTGQISGLLGATK